MNENPKSESGLVHKFVKSQMSKKAMKKNQRNRRDLQIVLEWNWKKQGLKYQKTHTSRVLLLLLRLCPKLAGMVPLRKLFASCLFIEYKVRMSQVKCEQRTV